MRLSRLLLGSTGRLLAIIVLGGVIALFQPVFLLPANLINVLRQASLMIVLASGLTFTVMMRGIDLSVAAVLAAGATAGGYLFTNGYPWPVAIFVPLLIGLGFGLITGLLVTRVGLTPFIASYGTQWVAQGVANLIMQGQIFFGFPAAFLELGTGRIGGIPIPVIVALAIVAALMFMQNKTVIGREIYAIGANPTAARFAGVSVRRATMLAYAVSGLMAAVAGLIMIARMDAAEASISEGLLLPALAAVVVGGTSLSGGRGGIGGTVLGAILMTIIINGMNLFGIPSFWQPLVVGVVIVASVAFDRLSRLVSDADSMNDAANTKRPSQPSPGRGMVERGGAVTENR